MSKITKMLLLYFNDSWGVKLVLEGKRPIIRLSWGINQNLLLCGGVSPLTGIAQYCRCALKRVSIILYTHSDYMHTCILYIIP